MYSVFIIDVDGVLTDGLMYYAESGKAMKTFGPDDHDALNLLRPLLEIRFISGDKKGFEISRRRIVEDMDYPLDLVNTRQRFRWITDRYDPARVIYMGDGIFDVVTLSLVGYGIAPANADMDARRVAKYVTKRRGGDRAVAEACKHLLRLLAPARFENYLRDQ